MRPLQLNDPGLTAVSMPMVLSPAAAGCRCPRYSLGMVFTLNAACCVEGEDHLRCAPARHMLPHLAAHAQRSAPCNIQTTLNEGPLINPLPRIPRPTPHPLSIPPHAAPGALATLTMPGTASSSVSTSTTGAASRPYTEEGVRLTASMAPLDSGRRKRMPSLSRNCSNVVPGVRSVVVGEGEGGS